MLQLRRTARAAMAADCGVLLACANDVLQKLAGRLGKSTEPGPGPHPTFDSKDYERAMASDGKYIGTANSWFRLDLSRTAIPNQHFSLAEIDGYAKANWSVSVAMSKNPEDPRLSWRQPIGVAVASKTTPGENGALRKISGDIEVFAFLREWQRWLNMPDSKNMTAVSQKALALFERAASHVPMDYFYFENNAEFEEQVFLKSVQVLEDMRRDEEEFAPSGWQACTIFAQARLMQKSKTGDASAENAERLLSRVTFASSSDYKITKESRTVEDGLRLYDRVMSAQAEDILLTARATLGPKSALTSFSKLVVLTQKVPK